MYLRHKSLIMPTHAVSLVGVGGVWSINFTYEKFLQLITKNANFRCHGADYCASLLKFDYAYTHTFFVLGGRGFCRMASLMEILYSKLQIFRPEGGRGFIEWLHLWRACTINYQFFVLGVGGVLSKRFTYGKLVQ